MPSCVPFDSEPNIDGERGARPQEKKIMSPITEEDDALLSATTDAVRAAGERLKERYSIDARLDSLAAILEAIHNNDDASLDVMKEALLAARPGSMWAEDELDAGPLLSGEWWVTDPVEGNINHIHGMADWCVTATLVRDNDPVMTVVYLPLTGDVYTAVRDGGAYQNGNPLKPSAKTDLEASLVGTGQAKPGETSETFRRIGRSVTAMLEASLVVRVSVPATLQLIHVAAGRMDVFWQFSQVRSGLLAGALLVREAGGMVTDVQGRPWRLASDDFLASTPGLHASASKALSSVVQGDLENN